MSVASIGHPTLADGGREPDVLGCGSAPTPPNIPPLDRTPEQPFARVCIHADGDLPCPSSDYPNRFVSYRTVSDTRTCNPCVATPSDSICVVGGNTSTQTCGVETGQPIVTTGGCTSLQGFGALGTLPDPDAGAQCNVDGGGRDGGIALTDAVTFCCAN